MGPQKTPETYKKASQNHLEETSKKSPFSKPKKGCGKIFGSATKLRLGGDIRRTTTHRKKNKQNPANPPTQSPSRPGAFGPERISIACGNNPLRAWGRCVSENWVEDKFGFIFVSCWVHFAIIFVTILHSVFIYL